LSLMRNDNAVNGPSRRNGNIINDSIDRVAQKFETGNKSNIELAARKPLTERRWMIEIDLPSPPLDERAGIEIFDAADAKGFQSG
jgi:hypothetical protein